MNKKKKIYRQTTYGLIFNAPFIKILEKKNIQKMIYSIYDYNRRDLQIVGR